MMFIVSCNLTRKEGKRKKESLSMVNSLVIAQGDLFIHDARQLGQHVPVVSSHLLLVLQLVLLDQTLVHI